MARPRTASSNIPSLPSRRSAVMGLGPVVATSQPLAAQAGLQAMLSGGNAFDAAVATAAVLAVVEPTGCGMGGDAFALSYLAETGEVRALNGSGRSPRGMDAATLRAEGIGARDRMPTRGALTVTVPGAVDAWATLLEAHGSLPLSEALAPAIAIAENGYPVSELIASAWCRSEALLAESGAAGEHFLPSGRAPRAGEVVRMPSMARSFRQIAEGGPDAFYRGPIADAIANAVQSAGGALTRDDLALHTSTWDQPISVEYGSLRVWECPPNGQGIGALLALCIARGLDLDQTTWGGPRHLHLLVEAMRFGLADAHRYVSDPAFGSAPVEELLSQRYTERRRALVAPDRANPSTDTDLASMGSDTVYLATVDDDGNACSFIYSNYMGFGSGLVAGETGIALQNRGAGFTLEPDHPNTYEPGKRPFHTIIPGMATRADGSLALVFGVMGGHMQPQGHLQVIANMETFGMGPQGALDAPRFQITQSGRLALEPWFGDDTHAALSRMGHAMVSRQNTPSSGTFGGGQVIAVTEEGVRIAGSDPRKDGQAVAAVNSRRLAATP